MTTQIKNYDTCGIDLNVNLWDSKDTFFHSVPIEERSRAGYDTFKVCVKSFYTVYPRNNKGEVVDSVPHFYPTQEFNVLIPAFDKSNVSLILDCVRSRFRGRGYSIRLVRIEIDINSNSVTILLKDDTH